MLGERRNTARTGRGGKNRRRPSAAVAALVILATAVFGPAGAAAEEARVLTGAGATFPYPLYSKYFDAYGRERGVRVNYQSIGSGGGIRQITEETVDFGASDAPMTDEQLAKAPGPILHIPTALGAVVPTYNMPGNVTVRFTGEVLADIFLGKIKKWNDPRLQELNPELSLPDQDIVVVHRSDGSGTTYVWVDYLSKVSKKWAERVGRGTSVSWPVGLGGKGNEGVAGLVKRTPGALGYVELIYALANNLDYGAVRNRAGEFVKADMASVSRAAAGALDDMPDDLRVSITDAPGKGVYPVSAFTYLLIYANQKDEAKGRAVANLAWWVTHEGQRYNEGLHYGRLPAEIMPKVEARLALIKYRGQVLLPQAARGRGAGVGTVTLVIGRRTADVKGRTATLEAAPYIAAGRTMVPVRVVAEALGAQVQWDPVRRTVVIRDGDRTVELTVGQKSGRVASGGSRRAVALEAPAAIVAGRTFVPVRFVSEALGYKVVWQAESRSVVISR